MLYCPHQIRAGSLLCGYLLILLCQGVSAGRIEAGTFTAHQTFNPNINPVRINFQQVFDTVPIVVALADSVGGNSASIRITNVTTRGFDELILEADNFDGGHLAQTVGYIALEPGRHLLPGGHVIEAGRLATSATQFGNGFTGGSATWTTVNFSAALPTTPTLISQIQSANSETRNVAAQTSRPHITAISQNAGLTSFQVALDRSQANSGPFPGTETIGWIAFPAGTIDNFPDTAGNPVQWSAVNSAANIRGWSNGCFTNNTGLNSGASVVVAKKRTRNSNDGGWFRGCNGSATTVGLRVDEDTDQDGERGIDAADAESAAIIAFSRAFHANLRPDLTITKTTGAFDDNLGSDKALPGGSVEYIINVSNAGNAPPDLASVTVTDALPPELVLIVSDFTGDGDGPVLFTDGAPASGLSCDFTSLASSTDCIDFSIDGVNFDYVPSDSGTGFDPTVTHIRVTPTGFMASDRGGGPTSFSLRLRAIIR